jgi:hypothetical protein
MQAQLAGRGLEPNDLGRGGLPFRSPLGGLRVLLARPLQLLDEVRLVDAFSRPSWAPGTSSSDPGASVMQIGKMSVIPADKFIAINDEGYAPCNFTCAENVHAIQWRDGFGQVEISRGPARGFTNIDLLDPYIRPWRVARATHLRAQHAHRAQDLAVIEAHVASTDKAVEQLADELAKLNTQYEAAEEEAHRAALEGPRTIITAELARARQQLTTLQASRDSQAGEVALLDQRALQAEAEAAQGAAA